jgi:hypothetical protein
VSNEELIRDLVSARSAMDHIAELTGTAEPPPPYGMAMLGMEAVTTLIRNGQAVPMSRRYLDEIIVALASSPSSQR